MAKYYFVPVQNKRTRMKRDDCYLSIHTSGAIVFSTLCALTYGMDGCWIKFFKDKSNLAIQIKKKGEISELSSRDFIFLKKNKYGVLQASIMSILKEMDLFGKKFLGVKLEEYKDDIYGILLVASLKETKTNQQ